MRSFQMPVVGRWLMVLARIALGLVFLYAAYTKLKLPWLNFAAFIYAYQILPDWGVELVARTLPWFELLLGVLLLTGYKLRFVGIVASGLLIGFFAAMVRSYALGMQIECGCFGPGDTLSAKTLVRDGFLLLVSLALTVAAFLSARQQTQAQRAGN